MAENDDSIIVKAGAKTYFFDFKQTRDNKPYLLLTESRFKGEGEAGGAYSSPGYTADVLNGMAAEKTLPSVDPERIGMWGHSMGGYHHPAGDGHF